MYRYRFVNGRRHGPSTVDDMVDDMLRQRSVNGPSTVDDMVDDMLRQRSVNGPFTGLVGFLKYFWWRHAASLLRGRCADRNSILRPQPMKHLDGFSDDFGDDFGVILAMILVARIIALKQGRA